MASALAWTATFDTEICVTIGLTSREFMQGNILRHGDLHSLYTYTRSCANALYLADVTAAIEMYKI